MGFVVRARAAGLRPCTLEVLEAGTDRVLVRWDASEIARLMARGVVPRGQFLQPARYGRALLADQHLRLCAAVLGD